MTNTRNMTGPRTIDTRWPQTIQTERRRVPRKPEGPPLRTEREPINWPLCLMLAGAGFLTVLTLAYKLTGPAL